MERPRTVFTAARRRYTHVRMGYPFRIGCLRDADWRHGVKEFRAQALMLSGQVDA